MIEELETTNKVHMEGKIISNIEFSHEMYGEGFYNFRIEVPRLSSAVDVLPVTVSERLMTEIQPMEGDLVSIDGQLRSYNKFVDGVNRLILTIFTRDIKLIDNISKSPNQIYMEGYICKPPIYRTTPFGREITDLLIAVNRSYNKSDYIPTIAWGRNARFSNIFEVGLHIRLWGRIQSREYEKRLQQQTEPGADCPTMKRTAYEVSISKMEKIDQKTRDGTYLCGDDNEDETEL